MGVKRFLSEMCMNIDNRETDNVVSVFIDANTYLYEIFGTMYEPFAKAGEGASSVSEVLPADAITMCVNKIKNDLLSYPKLEEIIFCLDGVPNNAKLINQYIRRKNTKLIPNVISDAMILPGNKLVDDFSAAIETMLATVFEHKKIIVSNNKIPGEGEHKMLDLLRYNKNASEGKEVILWADDSDVPIALLSSSYTNILIRYKTVNSKAGHIYLAYALSDLRNKFANNEVEKHNIPILLSFMGNDYLPEIPGTLSIKDSYQLLRSSCRVALTNNNRLNYVNIEQFLRTFAREHEYDFTVRGVDITNQTFQTKRDFKVFYYHTIYQKYYDIQNVSESDLFIFEMEMAVSYMKVFIWNYYYTAGYYMQDVEEPYYEYSYPPLLNSLICVLSNKNNYNDLIRFMESPTLVRGITYFEELPDFRDLHVAAVLNNDDFDMVVDNDQFRAIRMSTPFFNETAIEDNFIKIRSLKNKLNMGIEFIKKVDIKRMILQMGTPAVNGEKLFVTTPEILGARVINHQAKHIINNIDELLDV